MKNFACWLCLVIVLSACNVSISPQSASKLPEPTAGTKAQQIDALKAARAFAVQIDRGDYEGTWDDAGPALKNMVSKFMWVNTLKLSRKAFDVASERTSSGLGFSTQIDQNVPVGDYVLVQFVTKSRGMTMTEKVVMQKDEGRWKIIGYFITKRVEYKSAA